MPTWGELLKEFNNLQEQYPALVAAGQVDPSTSPADLLRRKYLAALGALTGRAVILYSTAWLETKPGIAQDALTVNLGDIQGFMEAVSNIDERQLDLVLHSPGGSAEAAESITEYLRTRFDHVRVFVPIAAMSAATMIALAGDEIVMGAHSQLGPIDPQFTIITPEGPRSAPGQAIKDQFELAKQECRRPENIGAWLPILRSYAPGLLAQCDHQRMLAEDFVGRALERYMFARYENAQERATQTAAWFAEFTRFRSHGRRVSRDDARAQGVSVLDLESDDGLQDAVLSVHHATALTFGATPAAKIIENHRGRAWMTIGQQIQIQVPVPLQPPTTPPPGPQPPPPTPQPQA